jgi:hypothetical protein
MPKPLPEQPSLEQLKKQAKELLKLLKSGDHAALQRVSDLEPPGIGRRSNRLAGWSLSTAQQVVAREHGFASWTKLKAHVAAVLEKTDPIAALHGAFAADNSVVVDRLLGRHPEIRAKINEPIGPFDSPAIIHVKSPRMLDVLVKAGADLNAKSHWWAGGFGLLHCVKPELAAYAIQRGAVVDVHAAARLGLFEELRLLINRDPTLVNARGGDGQTPLHFAANVEVATLLLENGADIDARDVDHESTPAQYMVGDRQDVLKHLVQKGCQTDILMAAALGDQVLAERHLQLEPNCIRTRVSDEYFPKRNPRSGGTIYQWTLGWHVSAPQVADNFGHPDLAEWLTEQCPLEMQLTEACWRGQSARVENLLRRDPTLTKRLQPADQKQLAHAARNNNLPAVKLFVAAGLPLDVRGQHGATPLHWAAWHGNVEMVTCLLRFDPPLEAQDSDFHGTPLGWAIHGSQNGWQPDKGDYAATVQTLLEAGALPPEKVSGTEPVQAILRASGIRSG